MTVKELIEKLHALPQDVEVFFKTHVGSEHVIEHASAEVDDDRKYGDDPVLWVTIWEQRK